MTVAELILKLEQLDPNLIVVAQTGADYLSDWEPVSGLEVDLNTVRIEAY